MTLRRSLLVLSSVNRTGLRGQCILRTGDNNQTRTLIFAIAEPKDLLCLQIQNKEKKKKKHWNLKWNFDLENLVWVSTNERIHLRLSDVLVGVSVFFYGCLH